MIQSNDEDTLTVKCPRAALANLTYGLVLCDIHAADMQAQSGAYYLTEDGATAWADVPEESRTGITG